ncbi:MucB/RseB C-terminal domain-containing protein [Ectopseudomonas mendocina]|uniref:MucB/RseB C-terminal domain-containing protein n=1 Tax=Ectopseudomonas mendocina TaxID=300 RepID=A0ABZ2RD41_ECTME
MRFIPFSVVLVAASWLSQPASAADGQDLLQRLNDAQRKQSFHGTFVYDSNGAFSTHGIWSLVGDDGHARLRLLQLDGAEQEVLRVDGQVECASGEMGDELSKSQLWSARQLDPKQLNEWYELIVLGDSRVAGRPTTVLALVPRDQNRYGLKLHLDRQTGLPLKSLLVNQKGQLLERFQFTRLHLEAPTSAALEPGAGCRPVQDTKQPVAQASEWITEWLPPGFVLSSTSQRLSPVSDEPVACQVYGDGLASFSIFVEPLKGAVAGDFRTQLGPTAAVSRRVQTADGDVMVTVVGEIPVAAAERVASSLKIPRGSE